MLCFDMESIKKTPRNKFSVGKFSGTSHSREAFYKECVGKFFWRVYFQRDGFRRAEARCGMDAEKE